MKTTLNDFAKGFILGNILAFAQQAEINEGFAFDVKDQSLQDVLDYVKTMSDTLKALENMTIGACESDEGITIVCYYRIQDIYQPNSN